MNELTPYTLRQLIVYFLKLGTIGFGGPVALVGYMHRDLVERRKWISEEEYKEGLALAQLAPGPLAAQLGIYIGFVHYKVVGATLVGLAFVLPSFVMVVLLGIAYKLYGGLPLMQSIFYGVGAAVVGIIFISTYKLTIKSIGAISLQSFKEKWMLWIFFTTAMVLTYVTENENIFLFISAGILYMLFKSPPKISFRKGANSVMLLQMGLGDWDNPILIKIALFFLKAGAFVFGSGLAIVPFLHSGVVAENRWLTENQFVDAVAVAMVTPGPVVITVGFIGYLIAGFPGASVAALATFLPCYFFTIIPAPFFKKISKNQPIKAFVEGITAAVIGALAGAVIVIALRSIKDIPTLLISVFSILSLLYIKKIQEPYVILIAAILGIIIKELV